MKNQPVRVQKMSEPGLALLALWEGFRLVSYLDSAGLETIGVGHLITDFDRQRWQHKKDRKGRYALNHAEVIDLLEADVEKVERAVRRLKHGEWRNPNVFDSCCSFLFNLGTGITEKAWFRMVVVGEDIRLAESKWPLYVNAGGRRVRGLVIRRHEELSWMRKGEQK